MDQVTILIVMNIITKGVGGCTTQGIYSFCELFISIAISA
jgi:hypothetical protein